MNATEFFYAHAGFSYDPKNETEEQGLKRRAEALAKAEAWASEQDLSYEWRTDPTSDSSDWRDDVEPYETWECIIRNSEDDRLGSLCGIDFGPDGDPWQQPYRRVVEAELALKAIDEGLGLRMYD